jgi:hypothetical protein
MLASARRVQLLQLRIVEEYCSMMVFGCSFARKEQLFRPKSNGELGEPATALAGNLT